MQTSLFIFFIMCSCGSEKQLTVTSEEKPADNQTVVEEVDVDIFYPADDFGPYASGVDDFTVQNRHGLELPALIWYPTSPNDSVDPYVYDDVMAGTALEFSRPDCEQQRPVVLFSHGNGGMNWQSYFLMEYLASHGYLVVAPNHVGNSLWDFEEHRTSEMVFRRPEDMMDTYDALAGQEKFSDCVDDDAGYAIIGHSFGGYTSLVLSGVTIDAAKTEDWCRTHGGWLCTEVSQFEATNQQGLYPRFDTRIWASIPMAPAGYEVLLGGLAQVEIPVLVIGGSEDRSTTMEWSVLPIYDAIGSSRKSLAVLEGAGHYSFTMACQLEGLFSGCGEGYMDIDVAHFLLNTMVTAFLGAAQGDSRYEAWLPPDSSEVSFERE